MNEHIYYIYMHMYMSIFKSIFIIKCSRLINIYKIRSGVIYPFRMCFCFVFVYVSVCLCVLVLRETMPKSIIILSSIYDYRKEKENRNLWQLYRFIMASIFFCFFRFFFKHIYFLRRNVLISSSDAFSMWNEDVIDYRMGIGFSSSKVFDK